VDASDVPRLIDEIPVLAIAASQAEGDSAFHGVGELRTKESDRLAAIVEGLRGLGGEAEAAGDTLFVRGPRKLSGGIVDSGGDHRMAMAFAVAGLVSSASIRINGWSCVQTSFPTFLDLLGTAQAGGR
jgi:3-phosphoshikimate 1-carboxyvinyltransferase